MAIEKTIATIRGTGNEISHHVIRKISVNKEKETLSIVVESYHSPTNYTEGSVPSEINEVIKPFSALPQPLITAGVAFIDAIESAMVAGLPPYSGGVLVNDNGSPI